MVNRILIGDFGGGDYRMRGSVPGADVTTALAPEQLSFDSAWPDAAVILYKGTFATTVGNPVFNFPATLPQVPFVFLHAIKSTNEFWMGNTQSNGPNSFQWMMEVTTTFLQLRHGGSSGVATAVAFTVLRGPY